MIEVRYGDYREGADIAGRSIAEVREQYKEELDIPDKAKAILNGQPVRKEMELRMELTDGDKLSFEVKRANRTQVLVLAVLLALAVSGGVFAYTWTTATATISIVAPASDFADVTANGSYSAPTVFGKFTGIWPTGHVFEIVPDPSYTGDLVIKVYIANTGNLIRYYHHLNMLLDYQDSTNTTMPDQAEAQLLTLQNAEVQFYWSSGNGTPPYHIEVTGGGFRLHHWKTLTGGSVSPILYCEITQR